MTNPDDTAEIDIRERLVHIDQMLADTDRLRAETQNLATLRQAQALADIDRKNQEMRPAP